MCWELSEGREKLQGGQTWPWASRSLPSGVKGRWVGGTLPHQGGNQPGREMGPGPSLMPQEAGFPDGQRQDPALEGRGSQTLQTGGSCPPGSAHRVCEEGGARAGAPAPERENVAGGSRPDGSCISNPPELAQRGRCEGTLQPAQPGVPSVVTSPIFPASGKAGK